MLDWVLRVDGHTDDAPVVVVAGAFADNWELSAGRALTVVKYKTEELGFPPERLAAAEFGECRPVNPEDTEAARAQNRRIELKLAERRAQPCRNDHAPRTRRPLALRKPSV